MEQGELKGKFSKIKGNFTSAVNKAFADLSEVIQNENQKWLYLRGCITVSDESDFTPGKEHILYDVNFLASDVNGSYKVIKIELDLDKLDIAYYDMSGKSDFYNSKKVAREFKKVIEGVLSRVDLMFDKLYWDFNQIRRFENAYVYKPVGKNDIVYILLDNGLSYDTGYGISIALDKCKDDRVLCGTWKSESEGQGFV